MIIERLIGRDAEGGHVPKLPVHQFIAAMREIRRGVLTLNQVANVMGLTQENRDDVIALNALVVAGTLTVDEIEDVLFIAERFSTGPYATPALVRSRLGL